MNLEKYKEKLLEEQEKIENILSELGVVDEVLHREVILAARERQDVGDLQVQVGRQRVADVGLDQRLQPSAGRGQAVIVLQRHRVLRHRGHHIYASR